MKSWTALCTIIGTVRKNHDAWRKIQAATAFNRLPFAPTGARISPAIGGHEGYSVGNRIRLHLGWYVSRVFSRRNQTQIPPMAGEKITMCRDTAAPGRGPAAARGLGLILGVSMCSTKVIHRLSNWLNRQLAPSDWPVGEPEMSTNTLEGLRLADRLLNVTRESDHNWLSSPGA